MQAFLLWMDLGCIPVLSAPVRKAIYAHGRRVCAFRTLDDREIPFRGAEHFALWNFAASLGAPDFQNAIMRQLLQTLDDESEFGMHERCLLDLLDRICVTGRRGSTTMLRRMVAYKAWFLLQSRRYESFHALHGLAGPAAFGEAVDYLKTYYRDHKDSSDIVENVACLMNHVEDFMVSV
ncbi:uncharacterized protein RCC_06661 [Ramularia collo-cygni]|uniref:Heterokaryon incompatibility domain-containing protein n=1 Tax=Ramularia collo-cygni TaxID=112498 RepID=A0A2D3VIV8_9PEZI|nr:uncharacterized protein RCC_06661 [Ramularia collo-cygni]CZT20803.1 uncharacterized protein RCC_06661 [Ramularia collo-cygni]